jgi:hypothetical protein
VAQKSYSLFKKKNHHCIYEKPTKTRSKCKQRMKEKGSEQRVIPPWQQDSTPFTIQVRQGGQKGRYKRYRQAWRPMRGWATHKGFERPNYLKQR